VYLLISINTRHDRQFCQNKRKMVFGINHSDYFVFFIREVAKRYFTLNYIIKFRKRLYTVHHVSCYEYNEKSLWAFSCKKQYHIRYLMVCVYQHILNALRLCSIFFKRYLLQKQWHQMYTKASVYVDKRDLIWTAGEIRHTMDRRPFLAFLFTFGSIWSWRMLSVLN